MLSISASKAGHDVFNSSTAKSDVRAGLLEAAEPCKADCSAASSQSPQLLRTHSIQKGFKNCTS